MPPTLRSPDLYFRLEASTSCPPSRPVRFASRVDIRPMPAFVSTRPNQTGHHSRPTLSCSFLLTRIQLDWCALPSANQNRSSGVLRLSRRANLRHTHRLGHAEKDDDALTAAARRQRLLGVGEAAVNVLPVVHHPHVARG